MVTMSQQINQNVLDKLTKVCLCKGISRATIKEAIAEGHRTLQSVNEATGAGSGCCKGRRCGEKIEDLIQQVEEQEAF